MKTSNQLKQQLSFNVPRFHVWLCPNHVCVQPRSPQTVWVGGGSNCFPLVGTRDPPSTHPANSGGGVKQLPKCLQCLHFRFRHVQFEFSHRTKVLQKCNACEILEINFFFHMQMTKSHRQKNVCWRLSERTPWNLPN